MVQVLEAAEERPNFGSLLGQRLGGGISKGYSDSQEAARKLRGEEAAESRRFEREIGVEQEKSRLRSQEKSFEKEQNLQAYETMKNTYGKTFANVWLASETGARTGLVEFANDARTRGLDIDSLMKSGILQESIPGVATTPREVQQDIESDEFQEKPKPKAIDFDKGLTPAERTRRQEDRYKTNLPLYQNNLKSQQSHERQEDELGLLKDLNSQITTLDKFNVNPMTGEIFFPGIASAAAQEFSKVVNDFTRSAKDTYGGRVAVFELQSFMKRLPTLANSEEAREKIIEIMGTLNAMDLAYERELSKVIDEHGGVRNIDYDKAEELARKRSEPQFKELKKQLKAAVSVAEKEAGKELDQLKKDAPAGWVLMQLPDGTIEYLEKQNVSDAVKEHKWKVL